MGGWLAIDPKRTLALLRSLRLRVARGYLLEERAYQALMALHKLGPTRQPPRARALLAQ